MPTPTPDTLFQGDHKGTPNPADPNLYSLGDLAAAMGTDSLAVSVATSKVTSTAASGALDSVPVSTASSKATSAAAQASVADSKAVSTSAPTSVADSKAVSVSRNTSVADSKAVSLDNALIIPTVNSLPGYLSPIAGANVRTANNKMADVASLRDIVQTAGGGVNDDRASFITAQTGFLTGFSVPAGTYRINSDLTISARLTMQHGAVLKPANGVTITISPGFTAPVVKIFDTSLGGIVLFARGAAPLVYPEWWGAASDPTDTARDDAPAITAAFKAVRAYGGTVAQAQRYIVRSPIDITSPDGNLNHGCRMMNLARWGADDVPDTPSIFASHNGHVFDGAGAADLAFDHVSIHGDVANPPKTAFFLARNAGGSSCGRHRFTNCRTSGYFQYAAVYECGSEENEWTNCWIQNQLSAAAAYVCTANNVSSLSSTFITIATGPQSNVTHSIRGGSWWGPPSGDVFYLEGASSVKIHSLWAYAGDAANSAGRSIICVDGRHTTSDFLSAKDIHVEDAPSALTAYGVYVFGTSLLTHEQWTLHDWRANVSTKFVTCDDVSDIDQLTITTASSDGPAGSLAINAHNLSNADLRCPLLYITVRGTASYCDFTGYKTNWTIANRTGGDWFDRVTNALVFDSVAWSSIAIPNNSINFADTHAFTPKMKLGGTEVTSYLWQKGWVTVIGNQCTVWMHIAVNVVGAGTGAITITDLPYPCANRSLLTAVGDVMPSAITLAAGQVKAYMVENASVVNLMVFANGSPSTLTALPHSALVASTSDIMVTITYQI